MMISDEKQQMIARNVKRLALKNSGAAALFGAALKGALNGGFDREFVSQVFDIDPRSTESLDALILQSLLHHLAEEDIEEIFRRYARRKGLAF
jgi:hypothetical protein